MNLHTRNENLFPRLALLEVSRTMHFENYIYTNEAHARIETVTTF